MIFIDTGLPRKDDNVALDEDGEELTPHGSVENLFVSTEATKGSVFSRGPNSIPHQPMDNNKESTCKETGAHKAFWQSNIRSCSANQPITQIRRSTSMSTPSPSSGLSAKTVTFTLPDTETKSVRQSKRLFKEISCKLNFLIIDNMIIMIIHFLHTLLVTLRTIQASIAATRHIIPVNGTNGNLNYLRRPGITTNTSDKLSPEGEMYGFGEKFRENRKQYFNASANNR